MDSSSPALATAERNAQLNGFTSDQIQFAKGDMIGWMEAALQRGESYDVVVLDPPKLAPSRKSLERAKKKYMKLNRLGISLVKPGGLLVTCSCSSAMTRSGDFLETVSAAARTAKRPVSLLRKEGAAPDHALNPNCLEGEYLTALFMYVE